MISINFMECTMGFKDGLISFKDSFLFIYKNIKTFLLCFIFLFSTWLLAYLINNGYNDYIKNQSISLGIIVSSFLMVISPFVLYSIIVTKIEHTHKKYIKNMLLTPLKLRTYFYSMIFSFAFLLPIFISLNIIPKDFQKDFQNNYIQIAKIEQKIHDKKMSNEQKQIIVKQAQQDINKMLNEIPYFHIALSILTFIVVAFISIGMIMFLPLLMFSQKDNGILSNFKLSFKGFFKNIKGLFVYNLLILLFTIIILFINPFHQIEKVIDALCYCYLIFSMANVYQKIFINKENIDFQ